MSVSEILLCNSSAAFTNKYKKENQGYVGSLVFVVMAPNSSYILKTDIFLLLPQAALVSCAGIEQLDIKAQVKIRTALTDVLC